MSVGVGWLPATATRSVPARLRARADTATVAISKHQDFIPVTAKNAMVPIIWLRFNINGREV